MREKIAEAFEAAHDALEELKEAQLEESAARNKTKNCLNEYNKAKKAYEELVTTNALPEMPR